MHHELRRGSIILLQQLTSHSWCKLQSQWRSITFHESLMRLELHHRFSGASDFVIVPCRLYRNSFSKAIEKLWTVVNEAVNNEQLYWVWNENGSALPPTKLSFHSNNEELFIACCSKHHQKCSPLICSIVKTSHILRTVHPRNVECSSSIYGLFFGAVWSSRRWKIIRRS